MSPRPPTDPTPTDTTPTEPHTTLHQDPPMTQKDHR